MLDVSDGKGIKSLSSELCDTEPAFQKVCVLPHSTLTHLKCIYLFQDPCASDHVEFSLIVKRKAGKFVW